MNTTNDTNTRLRKPWQTIARVTWVAMVSITMVLFAAGLTNVLDQLRMVCMGGVCHPMQLTPAHAEFNEQLSFSLNFYAWYTTIVFAVFGSVCFSIAWLIFWQRSDDWMALFVSLWLVMMGAGAVPVIPNLGGVIFLFAAAGLFPLFVLFPDGRFVPRWMRWLIVGWVLFNGVEFVGSPPPTRGISTGPPGPITQVFFLIGIGAQVYRYWRVSTPLHRQQTKWAVFGFAGWFLSLVALLLALALFPALREPGIPEFFLDKYAFAFVGLLPILFIPLGIGVAILRYRLWEIDLIINKALVYGVLTTALALFYFLSIALFQGIFPTRSPIAIVLSTLAIAALFAPLRRRIQNTIDRRFYRRKYDAEKTLAAFSATIRNEVETEKLSETLLGVVEEAIQPAHVSLWLNPVERKTPNR